jgi:hypothetical protein
MYNKPAFTITWALLLTSAVQAQEWQPVTGTDNITALFSDTTHTATLREGKTATATYNADGTGELHAWGDVIERRWRVEGDDQVCIEIGTETRCFTIEVDASDTDMHRATNVATNETVVLSVSDREVTVAAPTGSAAGGASEPSAEEIAQKLANPNAPMASLTFRLQYRTFDGDLPEASSQNGTAIMFQPTFPFSLENGDVIFFRPNIPVQLSTPTIDPVSGGFKSESGLGDIVFDIAYGRTTKAGMLYAGGIVASLPTATEDALGTDRYSIGPEFMIGKLTKKYVIGIFPSHMWDVGGSGDADVNLTNIQFFGTYLPGGGWNVGSSPIMSYDHNSDQWTIPLNLTFGKTVIWSGRPWKLSMEINYFVERSDSFGPEWFVGFNVAPVVENVLARWFK